MSKAEHWRSHVKAQRASGMSQSEYCARNGLSPSSFGYWVQQLSKKRQASAGTFVTVTTKTAPIELVIGSVVVRISSGSDLSELRRIVEALS